LVAEVLLDHVPDGTDISAIELTLPGGHWRVCVRTQTPGHVIGRRGSTADAVRAAIAEHLGDPHLQFNIVEAGGPGAPPPAPPGGDREPRKPRPAAPASALAIEEPNGP
jgi:ribosomal protein S3